MSNGQEKARQNLSSFQSWAATQTDDDFKQIIFRGQLNRGEVARPSDQNRSAMIPALTKEPWNREGSQCWSRKTLS